MRDTIMLVVVLALVCIISALALALVNNLTEDRIAEQKRLIRLRAVAAALPRGDLQYDNDPSKDIIELPEWKGKDGSSKTIYLGKKNGKSVGAAFISKGEGYSGFITIMMGVDLEGKLTGIEVLEHAETPGMGANIETESFKKLFKGKSRVGSPEGQLEIVRDRKAEKNWEIEALTGATVSPRGVVQALNDGLTMFQKYRKRILSEGGTK